MPKYAVPAPYRDALAGLTALSDTDAEQLIRAFAEAPPLQQVDALTDLARQALPDGGEADALVPALLSLRGQTRGTDPAQVADDVSRSPDLAMTDETVRERFSERVAALLASDALATTANAVELLTHHEHNYQSASVLTDIRPLFGDDPSAQPRGAVLVEMLHLRTWGRDGSSQSQYIAMDETDLLQLRDAIDRALVKTESLTRFLENVGVAYFTLDEGE